MKTQFDCAILGNGPGALVAALYLARLKRSCVLIGAGKPRAAWISKTHNLIGFHKGISGKSLLKRMNQQVNSLNILRLNALGTVSLAGKEFQVKTGIKTFRVKKVIFATGFIDVQPKIKNLDKLRRSDHLRYCPICDAYEHRNKKIVILVKDDDGVSRAKFMLPFTRDILVLAIEDFRFSETQKKYFRKNRMRYRECEIESIRLQRRAPRVVVRLKENATVFSDAIYVELGSRINDSAFKNIRKIKKSNTGFLITTPEQRLSVPGLFAVGDCVNNLGQLSVAAAQAAVAAVAIHNEL